MNKLITCLKADDFARLLFLMEKELIRISNDFVLLFEKRLNLISIHSNNLPNCSNTESIH